MLILTSLLPAYTAHEVKLFPTQDLSLKIRLCVNNGRVYLLSVTCKKTKSIALGVT